MMMPISVIFLYRALAQIADKKGGAGAGTGRGWGGGKVTCFIHAAQVPRPPFIRLQFPCSHAHHHMPICPPHAAPPPSLTFFQLAFLASMPPENKFAKREALSCSIWVAHLCLVA